jgi:hypothetical protein
MTMINVSIFEVEAVDKYSEYGGYNVMIDGVQAYHRPYDGSSTEDVVKEAAGALGALLREKLDYFEEAPEEDEL